MFVDFNLFVAAVVYFFCCFVAAAAAAAAVAAAAAAAAAVLRLFSVDTGSEETDALCCFCLFALNCLLLSFLL